MRSMARAVSVVAVAAVAVAVPDWSGRAAQAPPAVILVTLDGARVEEIFGGLDVAVLKSTIGADAKVEANATFQRFWAPTPEARRSRLLPFFWDTLMRDAGSIAGNRALGSDVHVTNRLWFSYPGYSELLVGAAHDDVIKSNDATQNPYPTALEFLRQKLGASPNGVGLFSAWSVFRAIGESRPGTITINAGYQRYDHPDPAIRALGDRQFETPTPWDSVRHDLYTFQFAMAHLATYRPRVMYLALGETDDWAHDGRYDRVLDAYARSDRYLKELWAWVESQPDYRGRTSLLITTDHGRGRTPGDWREHGAKYPGAGDTWMAFVSPGLSTRGEWRDHAPITASQAAATLITWMGYDWREFNPAAAPPIAVR